MKSRVFLRRPLVPGFWPAIGVVGSTERASAEEDEEEDDIRAALARLSMRPLRQRQRRTSRDAPRD